MNKEEWIKKYIGELPTTIEERLENLQSLLQLKTMEIANLKQENKLFKQRVLELEVYKKALELLSVKNSEFTREYYIGKEDYNTYMKNDPIRTIKMYLNQARKELANEVS